MNVRMSIRQVVSQESKTVKMRIRVLISIRVSIWWIIIFSSISITLPDFQIYRYTFERLRPNIFESREGFSRKIICIICIIYNLYE